MELIPTLEELQRVSDMHAVYRMFDRDFRLLYVGVTGEFRTRFGDHSGKHWFPQVAIIRLEWFPGREAADLAALYDSEQLAAWDTDRKRRCA